MLTTYQRIKRYLLGVYFSFTGMTLVCIIIRPDIFDHPDYAISYFGSPGVSDVPYYFGFTLTLGFLLLIIRQLPSKPALRVPRLAFIGATLCMLAIMATSYVQGRGIPFWSHVAVGILLLLTQLAAVIWIVTQKDTRPADYLLAVLFVVGGVMGVLSSSWIAVLPGMTVMPELIVFSSNLLLLGRATLRRLAKG